MSIFKKINDGVNSLAIKTMTVASESKPQSKKALRAKKILTSVITGAIAATMCAVTVFASGGTSGGTSGGASGGASMPSFFEGAIGVLQTVVILIGAGVAVWGVINLLEGYSNDNPGAKSQGMKQLMAGIGVALIGVILVPQLQEYVKTVTKT